MCLRSFEQAPQSFTVEKNGGPAKACQGENRAVESENVTDPRQLYTVDAGRGAAAGPRDRPADVENDRPRRYSAAFRMA